MVTSGGVLSSSVLSIYKLFELKFCGNIKLCGFVNIFIWRKYFVLNLPQIVDGVICSHDQCLQHLSEFTLPYLGNDNDVM